MAASTTSISEGTYASLNSPDLNVYSTVGATSHSSSGAKSTVKSGKSSHLLRLAAVGLGLLCAILLTATIALCVLYARGLERLNARKCTWMDYKEQLQRDLIDLSNEKDQLQEDCTRLSNEKDQLQEDCTRLSDKEYQLRRDYYSLYRRKNQLQTDYNSLSNKKDQLQRDYDRLSRLYQLQKDCTSLKGQCITCPGDWKQFSSKCYFFSTLRKSWEDSLQDCKLQGADLVIIKSQEEQEFINQHAKGGHHWIGLKDSEDRTFEWVDGTLLQQAFWKAGSPDENRRAHCVLTGPGEELWVDTPCDFTWMWICEADASCV
ncbi:C-type lectin domain family 4 member G-like isoform X2 [Anguilla anguilla]|uniref:C-type lectin domain family 4 member G-like isoform X2 n=1 Tax=Anguilla anguilla TaxID=7936 RepID=UPI0015B03101|nr:C-type lectin domain family 4 member G-like isoform X2 [Anguilla anguilla]